MYKTMLNSKGNTLHKVRRNQSDMIMNVTFTGDIGYKRVYILDGRKEHCLLLEFFTEKGIGTAIMKEPL